VKVWSLIQEKKTQDQRFEQRARIRRRDPQADKVGGRVYSPDDIRALEEERVPWLRRRRR
jgi:hypothetical protein